MQRPPLLHCLRQTGSWQCSPAYPARHAHVAPRHVPPFRHVAVHPPASGAESEQRGAILPSAQMQMLGLAMEKYYLKLDNTTVDNEY